MKGKIPIGLTQWDTSKVGYVEIDMVVHCGSSGLGEYINTLFEKEKCSIERERCCMMHKLDAV